MVVHTVFVDDLGWLSDRFPDSSEDHRLLRVVLPDLLTLLAQILSHGGHLCVEVGVLRLDLFELPLCLVKLLSIRPLCKLLKDVSGAAVVQRCVGSPSDVLQPVILSLEVRHVVVHPLERIFGKFPRG